MRLAQIAFIVAATAVSSSGCHAAWSANIHHNSRGTACATTPIPLAIDLALATAWGAAIGFAEDDDEYAGAIILATVFGLSGIWGIVETSRCKRASESTSGGEQLMGPQRTRGGGSRSDPPVPLPASDTPIPKRPNPLRVPDDFLERLEPPEKQLTCRIGHGSSCPAGHTCVATEGDSGICKPTTERDPTK